jgi:predicted nicotinamide N-methyase
VDADLRPGPRRFGAWPAVWTAFDLPGEPGRELAVFAVDRLEDHIDATALLHAERVPEPPYWALVWIGARALAAHLLDHPPGPAARVLDLGCGLGLSGLAAALSGARVVFADYARECLPFVRASLEAHGCRKAEVRHLDFTREHLEERFDLIVAADIVYDPAAYEPLAAFLAAHLAEDGEILLTESLRADARNFLATLKAKGFEDEVTACWVEEDGAPQRTWIHRLRAVKA